METAPAEILRQRATTLVDTWRVPIDATCRAALMEVVDDGVARFATDSAADGAADAQRIDAALDALRTLLGDMTQQIRIQRFDALYAINLRSAVERLGPLWPFVR